tara:strand:- start:7785 stop:8303 length:519 start_codon:yes stop_codon:yes gene_type:complete
MKKNNSIFKDNKKNKKKNKTKKTRKSKKKAGSPLIEEIEKEENMKREISENLVISYLLAINLDFSVTDARIKAANLDKREYDNIVLIMQMELDQLIYQGGSLLDEISTQDVLFISRIMVNQRGDMDKLRYIYNNNLTIGDLGGGKKRKNKMSRWSYVKRCCFKDYDIYRMPY